MRYYVYPLSFQTPVHFGTADNGGNLESVDMVLSSDTIFSAICHEAGNTDIIEKLVNALQQQKLLISSAFPYSFEKDAYALYLPKPLYGVMKERPRRNLLETKREAAQQKKQKKEKYIRAHYLSPEDTGIYESTKMNREVAPSFAEPFMQTHVHLRGEVSEPFSVGAYAFAKNAGLFIIVGFDNPELEAIWDTLLASLGLTGIGGERSSGYGKFEVREKLNVQENSEQVDLAALNRLIMAKEATRYITLSATVPNGDEVRQCHAGYYKVKKRGGFIVSPGCSGVKRNTYYVLTEGSCLDRAVNGRVVTFSHPDVPHAIYRNGMGFCIGVVYDE